MGVDLGERRIGVSISDSRGVLASPHSVIARSDRNADHGLIAALVGEYSARAVVVGLPLTLSGERGPAARAAEAEAADLQARLSVPVLLHDERLTTVEAERRRREQLATRAGSGRRPGRARPQSTTLRSGIDAVAATVLLQSFLDERAERP